MKMQRKPNTSIKSDVGKIAVDMMVVQSLWTMWYLPFLLIGHIAMIIFSEGSHGNFFVFSQQSSRIFMLVVGILSFYFLTYYVKQGITRKNYFLGGMLGAIGLAMVVSVLSMIINGVQLFVIDTFHFNVAIENVAFYGISENWFLMIFIFAIHILTYYMIGWIVGMGYYRYGWIIGFGFVALAIFFSSLVEFFWNTDTSFLLEIGGPGAILIFPTKIIMGIVSSMTNMPIYVSFLGNILLLGVGFWLVRLITRRVVVKAN